MGEGYCKDEKIETVEISHHRPPESVFGPLHYPESKLKEDLTLTIEGSAHPPRGPQFAGLHEIIYCLHALFVCTPKAAIVGFENFLGAHWLLLVTFGLLKGPKIGVGQCAQGGIPVVHL